jgi:hypothetical protein
VINARQSPKWVSPNIEEKFIKAYIPEISEAVREFSPADISINLAV